MVLNMLTCVICSYSGILTYNKSAFQQIFESMYTEHLFKQSFDFSHYRVWNEDNHGPGLCSSEVGEYVIHGHRPHTRCTLTTLKEISTHPSGHMGQKKWAN